MKTYKLTYKINSAGKTTTRDIGYIDDVYDLESALRAENWTSYDSWNIEESPSGAKAWWKNYLNGTESTSFPINDIEAAIDALFAELDDFSGLVIESEEI